MKTEIVSDITMMHGISISRASDSRLRGRMLKLPMMSCQHLGNSGYPTLPVSFGRVKAVGPFHLVSMPVEVKDGVNV